LQTIAKLTFAFSLLQVVTRKFIHCFFKYCPAKVLVCMIFLHKFRSCLFFASCCSLIIPFSKTSSNFFDICFTKNVYFLQIVAYSLSHLAKLLVISLTHVSQKNLKRQSLEDKRVKSISNRYSRFPRRWTISLLIMK
jgi:hypothetical protein